ncbi:putative DNA-directed RNA polymerase [Helianthus debilis subsp. tardiflorus]
MPWEGYNFEDAVLISERLVYEDIYTSFHIRKYEIQINQGPERVTNEIPAFRSPFTPKFRQKWNCNAGILGGNR